MKIIQKRLKRYGTGKVPTDITRDVLSILPILQLLSGLPSFMAPGGRLLEMPKDTKAKVKPSLDTYIAVLDNVHFEWEDILQEGESVCKQDCILYLDTYFPAYSMQKFYLEKHK
jgi:hypothetical protein